MKTLIQLYVARLHIPNLYHFIFTMWVLCVRGGFLWVNFEEFWILLKTIIMHRSRIMKVGEQFFSLFYSHWNVRKLLSSRLRKLNKMPKLYNFVYQTRNSTIMPDYYCYATKSITIIPTKFHSFHEISTQKNSPSFFSSSRCVPIFNNHFVSICTVQNTNLFSSFRFHAFWTVFFFSWFVLNFRSIERIEKK